MNNFITKFLLALITTLILFSLPLKAKILESTPLEYAGPRQLAMGGAGIAIINGAETVYNNPAGLYDAGSHFNLPWVLPLIQYNIIGVGEDLINSVNDLNEAYAESGDDPNEASKIFEELVPKKFTLATSLIYGGSISGVNTNNDSAFFIGGYNRFWGSFNLLNPIIPRLDYNFKIDTTLGFAAAKKIAENYYGFKNLKLGFYFKHLNRISSYDLDLESETGKLTIVDIVNDNINLSSYDATGYALDIGFLTDVDTIAGPGKIGIVVNNISGHLEGKKWLITTQNETSGYEGDITVKIPTTAKIGIALQPFNVTGNEANFFKKLLLAADYDIVYPEKSFIKRLHLGLEQPIFGDWLKIQTGLNQGYMTGGFLIDTWYRLGLCYYTEEWGKEIGQNPHSFWLLTSGLYF